MTYSLPSVGQLGCTRQTGAGPLPTEQLPLYPTEQLPLFEIHGDVSSALCVLQPSKVRSSSPFLQEGLFQAFLALGLFEKCLLREVRVASVT